ncbi:MAG: prolipoprotein diacylglyceryl transferase [Candidatus Sumerlaeia bacterium]|nr:prolipoprotein diacylglyceryl transferase [Candidatus Sumerlaeia bacterium]
MHPVLFHIGSFNIACYGPLIALGVLIGVYLMVRRGKSVGIAPEFILDLTFYCVILGFVGSRVFFILGDLRGFAQTPWAYIFSRQGYVFFGGLLSALLFAIWFVRHRRVEPWQIGDVAAPSIALAHMFGRLGCFCSGCCYGRVCAPGHEHWGISFPLYLDPQTGQPSQMFNFAYWDHLTRYPDRLGPGATASLPVIPVQLYEAAANLLIFAVLMWLWRRRRFRGQVFAVYLMIYGAVRFALEFFRGDYGDTVFYGLLQRGQMSQTLCVLAIIAGAAIWWLRRKTPLQLPQPKAPSVVSPPPSPEPPRAESPPRRKNTRRR